MTVCALAFGAAVFTGLGEGLAGFGVGAWATGLFVFLISAARADAKHAPDVSGAEIASLIFIAATFVPVGAWLDTAVRLAAIGSLGICELK